MRVFLTGVWQDGSTRASTVPLDPRKSLVLARGESVEVVIDVVTAGGVSVDVRPSTTKSVVFTMRRTTDDGWKLTKTGVYAPPDPPNRVTLEITPADTKPREPGRYVYDVWLLDSGDSSRTVLLGTSPFVLTPSVTWP